MLTRDSVLHYWDARYGVLPIIGGQPVHARASAAGWFDLQDTLRSSVVNTPRFSYEIVAGETRQLMRLEAASSNVLDGSDDYSNASWTKSNITVTATATIAPDGNLTAQKLAATAAAATNNFQSKVINATIATKTVFIRKGSGATDANVFGVRNVTTATDLVFVSVNYDTGAITYLVGATGASIRSRGGWWELRITVAAGISSGNTIASYTGFSGGVETAGEHLYAWRDQLEPGPGTSAIKTTTGGASRAADTFYWAYTPDAQAKMAYVRFIERGTSLATTDRRLLQMGNAVDAGPRALIYFNGANGYRAFHDNSITSASSGAGLALPPVGAVVELVAVFELNGAVDLYQSINGAAPTIGGVSGAVAFAGAWSDRRLYLNSVGTTQVGVNDFAEVKLVKFADVVGVTAQARMDELRALALSPSGEVMI